MLGQVGRVASSLRDETQLAQPWYEKRDGVPRSPISALAAEYWDELIRVQPTHAKLIGDHRFDEELEDLSEAEEARLCERWAGLLERLEEVDPAQIRGRDRITRSLLEHDLKSGIERTSARLA